MIKQRTIDGLRAAPEAGKRIGRPIYVFTSEDGNLRPDDEEYKKAVQAVVAKEELGWSNLGTTAQKQFNKLVGDLRYLTYLYGWNGCDGFSAVDCLYPMADPYSPYLWVSHNDLAVKRYRHMFNTQAHSDG